MTTNNKREKRCVGRKCVFHFWYKNKTKKNQTKNNNNNNNNYNNDYIMFVSDLPNVSCASSF